MGRDHPDLRAVTTYRLPPVQEEKCEWAVIETGLAAGSMRRTPFEAAQAFLSIELEHTRILGSTIKRSPLKKAKIIKAVNRCSSLVPEEAKGIPQGVPQAAAKPFLLEELLVGYGDPHDVGRRTGDTLKWRNGTEDRLLLSMKGFDPSPERRPCPSGAEDPWPLWR